MSRNSIFLSFSLFVTVLSAQTNYPYLYRTIAGVAPTGDGGPASQAWINQPRGIVVDKAGNIYVSEAGSGTSAIRKITPSGIISTFANVYCEDLALDPNEVLHCAAYTSVYRFSSDGRATRIAGTGSYGFSGDGGPATEARLTSIEALVFDAEGNLYLSDSSNCRVRKVALNGIITTFAGNGQCRSSGNGQPAANASIYYPRGLAMDTAGNLYIAEYYRIRAVRPSGIIEAYAGSGFYGSAGDNGPALQASLGNQFAIRWNAGRLFIIDQYLHRVRYVDSAGTIRLFAGTSLGFAGDQGPATSAKLYYPRSLAVMLDGRVLIADGNNDRIRSVDAAGAINTFAGRSRLVGDGGPATSAMFSGPQAILTDAAGNIYVADTNNNVIRKIDKGGRITRFAGTGEAGSDGDYAPAIQAQLNQPSTLAWEPNGSMLVGEAGSSKIRRIDASGVITTLRNQVYPYSLATDSSGAIYWGEYAAVRKWVPGSEPVLYAGTGTSGPSSGDGGLATSATLNYVRALCVDPSGNLYLSESNNSRVRKVTPGGIITTALGGGSRSLATTPIPGNQISDGWVYSLDCSTPDVLFSGISYFGILDRDGRAWRISGNGPVVDSGVALNVSVYGIYGLARASDGTAYLADLARNRIRALIPNAPRTLELVSGDAQSGRTGDVLPNPLMVRLRGFENLAMEGIDVTWTIATGDANLSATTTRTNTEGLAGIGVTLGRRAGSIEITASVPNLTPVRFKLTAIEPPPAVNPDTPAISDGGVIGAGANTPFRRELAPGGLISVFGTNFAPAGTQRAVANVDIVNGLLPTRLGGVCVRIGGVEAPLVYVGSGQVNAQVPSLNVPAQVPLQLVRNCGTANELRSAAVTVSAVPAAPEFFLNGSLAVAVNAVTGEVITAAKPTRPGDVLTLYGTGFGPVTPQVVPGTLAPGASRCALGATLTLGTLTVPDEDVLYCGVTPGFAGLYQVNLRVPAAAPAGTPSLVLRLGTASSPGSVTLPVLR